MQKFLTASNNEVFFQPLQIMMCDPSLCPEDSIKDVRTVAKLASKKYDVRIFLSSITYTDMDCIIEIDISISGNHCRNCAKALNYIRNNIILLAPYAEYRTDTIEQTFKATKIDWHDDQL